MKPDRLRLRCYGERRGKIWQAFCVDLNLAVQGRSFPEVKSKLEAQIKSYLYDALEGEDKEYASQLIPRPAPLKFWLRYYYCKAITCLAGARKDFCSTFNGAMPPTLLQSGA